MNQGRILVYGSVLLTLYSPVMPDVDSSKETDVSASRRAVEASFADADNPDQGGILRQILSIPDRTVEWSVILKVRAPTCAYLIGRVID